MSSVVGTFRAKGREVPDWLRQPFGKVPRGFAERSTFIP